jgi:hypothetical protein
MVKPLTANLAAVLHRTPDVHDRSFYPIDAEQIPQTSVVATATDHGHRGLQSGTHVFIARSNQPRLGSEVMHHEWGRDPSSLSDLAHRRSLSTDATDEFNSRVHHPRTRVIQIVFC